MRERGNKKRLGTLLLELDIEFNTTNPGGLVCILDWIQFLY